VEETDAYVTALSQDRDEAWERVVRLTVLAKEMEVEAVGLRKAVSALAPQTYETLGRRAQNVLALTIEESEALRAAAQDEAQCLRDAADAAARQAGDEARAYADEVRADTEARSQQLLLAAQTTADEVRIEARREAKGHRGEAMAALKEMRGRTGGMLADLGNEQAERWEVQRCELASCEAELDARHTELATYAEAALAEARRIFAQAEEYARHGQEDAEVRAAELICEARVREERTERETERVLRKHEEAREEMQAYMDHIRNSLATLTSRAAAECCGPGEGEG
jgi:hypothetical protein